MRRRGRILLLAATMAAANVGAVAVSTPAHAALAPSCMVTWTHKHLHANHVHIWNTCTGYRRVKVILAGWGDSECYGIWPGDVKTHSHQFGRFDRLESC